MEPKSISIGKREQKGKITTMKRWGILSWMGAIVLTVVLIYGVFFTDLPSDSLSLIQTITACAWAEVAAYNVVYAYKSKMENKLKITYDFIERLGDKYGIEAITPILQSIMVND